MVRINLIKPSSLSDQHLIAEYNEILMLLGYVRRYPSISDLPEKYCLGKGHIRFFKDKLLYLKKRHELIKEEMRRRGFRTGKTISLREFPLKMRNDWKPKKDDKDLIKRRIIERLKRKPHLYTYCGKRTTLKYLITKVKTSS